MSVRRSIGFAKAPEAAKAKAAAEAKMVLENIFGDKILEGLNPVKESEQKG